MRIAIIGSGNVGGTLARRLPSLGHEVSIANARGPQSLGELAAESGARAATLQDAARDAEVVVLAVPLGAVPDLAADVFAGTVVIDATNYYPGRDGHIAALEGGTPSSAWITTLLPGASVAKTFNIIQSQRLMDDGRPAGDPGRSALPVAGDDMPAKRVAMALVEELGFDAVDAGGLDESWRQQPGTPVYAAGLGADGVEQALGQARR